MSYCRRGIDGSDVTAFYDHERRIFVCEKCVLATPAGIASGRETPWAFLSHMQEHRDAGHSVPDHVFAMLKLESEDWPPTETPAAAEDKS